MRNWKRIDFHEQIKNLEGELAAARGGGWISLDRAIRPDKSGHYLDVRSKWTAGKAKREM
jgi:hypothetical protein